MSIYYFIVCLNVLWMLILRSVAQWDQKWWINALWFPCVWKINQDGVDCKRSIWKNLHLFTKVLLSLITDLAVLSLNQGEGSAWPFAIPPPPPPCPCIWAPWHIYTGQIPTLMSFGAIRALDDRANQDALVSKHAGTRFAIVLSPRGRVAIETLFATRAVVTNSVVLAETLASVWVALVSMIVAFTTDTSDDGKYKSIFNTNQCSTRLALNCG